MNDRIDATSTLILLNIMQGDVQNKLVYVPIDNSVDKTSAYLKSVEGYFGVPFDQLLSGEYDANELTQVAKTMIFEQGYHMDDTVSRMGAIRNILYTISNKTLSITDDGKLFSILPKEQVLAEEYLAEDGLKKFMSKLRKGEIKSINNVLTKNIKLPNARLEYVPFSTLKSKARYISIDGKATIQLSQKADFNSLMHELTHITQELLSDTENEFVSGGQAKAFKALPKETRDSLDKYISDNFPILYTIAKTNKSDFSSISYFMLGGELQANSTLGTHMFDIGFKWEKE